MPSIRPSADLRNSYNEISDFCHQCSEPVFITKNGKGDLAVMSIEAYEEIKSRLELYSLIQTGLDEEKNNKVKPFDDVITNIQEEIANV